MSLGFGCELTILRSSLTVPRSRSTMTARSHHRSSTHFRLSRMSTPLSSSTASARGMLWIDGVGGYLVCWGERVVLGQPVQGLAGSAGPEIGIWGDLSRQHAAISRVGEGYTLEPLRTTKLDDRTLTEVTMLADGQRIQLGDSVRLNFRQPHPWSRSARLELTSHHRPQPAADGVLLAAEVLILGPGPHCHVVCPGWKHEVLLVRQGDEWSIRSTGQLFCGTERLQNPARIAWGTSIQTEETRLTLEVL